jgi:hypothetical protein
MTMAGKSTKDADTHLLATSFFLLQHEGNTTHMLTLMRPWIRTLALSQVLKIQMIMIMGLLRMYILELLWLNIAVQIPAPILTPQRL